MHRTLMPVTPPKGKQSSATGVSLHPVWHGRDVVYHVYVAKLPSCVAESTPRIWLFHGQLDKLSVPGTLHIMRMKQCNI